MFRCTYACLWDDLSVVANHEIFFPTVIHYACWYATVIYLCEQYLCIVFFSLSNVVLRRKGLGSGWLFSLKMNYSRDGLLQRSGGDSVDVCLNV